MSTWKGAVGSEQPSGGVPRSSVRSRTVLPAGGVFAGAGGVFAGAGGGFVQLRPEVSRRCTPAVRLPQDIAR